MSSDRPTLTWHRDECITKGSNNKVNRPTPRSGYSLSTVGGNVFLFGGLDDSSSSSPPGPNNDLYVLRLKSGETHEWSRIEITNCAVPLPRWRHTASQINDTEFLIFGGHVSSFHRYNDVWVFNAITMCWRQPVPKSSKVLDYGNHTVSEWTGSPSPRGGHVAVVIRDLVYVIGGHGGEEYERAHLNDVFALDTKRWTWASLVPSGESPLPEGRSGHGACAVGDLIYIFGGNNSQAQFDDLYVLDPSPDTCSWTKIVGCNLPSAIYNHGAVAIDDYIFVFGGVQQGGVNSEYLSGNTYKNDVWVLNVNDEEPQWYSPPNKFVNNNDSHQETQPKPRSDIDMTFFSKWIITFGGWADKWFEDVLILDVSSIIFSHE
eukprot:15365542-Ditylum_brightwellii.AAC.2